MVGAGHGQESAQAQGVCGVLGTGSFVWGRAGEPCSLAAASKAGVAAGIADNYHFAGVKQLVFCPFFILVGFSLKTCTGSVLVFNTGRGGCCVFLI